MNGHIPNRGLAGGGNNNNNNGNNNNNNSNNSKGSHHHHHHHSNSSTPTNGNNHNGNNHNNKNHHHDGNVPTLCIQPETPVPPSCHTTPVPFKVEPGGGGLPALSSARSLINGGHPSPSPSPRFGHSAAHGFEHKPVGATGGGSTGHRTKGVHMGRGATSGLYSSIKTEVNSGGYGPQVIPLNPRNGNHGNNGKNHLGAQVQNYGHSPRQIASTGHSNLALKTANLSMSGGGGGGSNGHHLHLPSQALQTHTPTPSEISNITARSVTSPRQTLHTPLSIASDRASLSTPGAYSNNGGTGSGGGGGGGGGG
ncbi:hybrid signal transduction histidine kinase G-like, partial [Littorina saxatilis]|uniref:hybrid signal transduction histidine kinase G-like n=1 Tax=Littorina saxatilis TaxID=31220 RepID=UPI0038B511DE